MFLNISEFLNIHVVSYMSFIDQWTVSTSSKQFFKRNFA